MMLSLVTPRTPCDLLAALALSPTTTSVRRATSVPTFHVSPPTPPGSPSCPSPSHMADPPADDGIDEDNAETPLRVLATNEAKQLSLLLTQHFFPVRGSPKGLMKESIALAEKLHEAGIRWDKKRRVMGMHLRGIWEESQKLGTGRGVGAHGPME